MYAVTWCEECSEIYDYGFLGVFDEKWKVQQAVERHKDDRTQGENNRTEYTVYSCDLDGDYSEVDLY